jgi:hypothetical protein
VTHPNFAPKREGGDTVPSEAWDETHPDHDWWVRQTGRCLADHAHPATKDDE